MNAKEIAINLVNAAEKVASIEYKGIGGGLMEALKNMDARCLVPQMISSMSATKANRIQATLDVAYLLGNLDGNFTEARQKRFEEIAVQLGKTPDDISAHAVGYNAQLAHIRTRVMEEDLIEAFVNGCHDYAESFGGHLIPSRRAFALWITLGLADGEMGQTYRKALEALRREFKHSAMLFGAMGALPAYAAGAVVGGAGIGVVSAILGGMKMLKHKQKMDMYCPLISEEFMQNAETILIEILSFEKQLAEHSDMQTQEKYNSLLQQLENLITPPADDEEENDEVEDADED